MNNIEKIKKPQGQIGMILHKGGEYDPKTGTIKNGEILAQKEIKNLIVDKASELMAARLAPSSTYYNNMPLDPDNDDFLSHGLQYLAVGVGILNDPDLPYHPDTNPVNQLLWNPFNPPVETLTTTKLEHEIERKAFTSWSFIDATGADSVDSGTGLPIPTNRLKLVTTFLENEAIGPLTEMGLFGGNAEAWNNGGGKNSGFMFNYKTFPVWSKPNSARLTISWILTF